MNKHLPRLARLYVATLRKYVEDDREAVLEQAYELGRVAIARGLGVLDMVRIHQQALEGAARTVGSRVELRSVTKAADAFFLEALSPFEATHRGFRETSTRLQQVNATLEKRNQDLSDMNRELGMEIRERKRTERALRDSEGNLRELFEEARRMEGNLRRLSNQVLHAQEAERGRISRELHDEVGQALTAISVTLASLMRNGAVPADMLRHKLNDAQRLVRETMQTVHNFAHELRPAMLDELGLLSALRSCLHGFAERTGLRVQFRGDAGIEKLDADQKTVLFRVAQESLTNVAKHARASHVGVTIRRVGDGIHLEVADNGGSFHDGARRATKAGHRLGLLGMQERVRLINGTFVIKAQPGKGTTVRVVIPLNATGPSATGRPVRYPARFGSPPRVARPGRSNRGSSAQPRSHYE